MDGFLDRLIEYMYWGIVLDVASFLNRVYPPLRFSYAI